MNRPAPATSFEAIYEQHFSRIFRYVLIRVGNVAEAQDLTSQVFFKALQAHWRLRWSPSGVGPWLYRIATNEIASHFRSSRSRGRWQAELTADDLEAVADERETAEDELQRQELLVTLGRALRTLDQEDQTLVVLRYFEKKRYSEIARILRQRKGTLAMRTHRALRKLRAELEKQGVNDEGVREGFAGVEDTGYRRAGVPGGTPT